MEGILKGSPFLSRTEFYEFKGYEFEAWGRASTYKNFKYLPSGTPLAIKSGKVLEKRNFLIESLKFGITFNMINIFVLGNLRVNNSVRDQPGGIFREETSIEPGH